MVLTKCGYCKGEGMVVCPRCFVSVAELGETEPGEAEIVEAESGEMESVEAESVEAAAGGSPADASAPLPQPEIDSHLRPVPDCPICNGTGRVECPGCVGTGWVDFPAMA